MSQPRAGIGTTENASPTLFAALTVRFLLEIALLVGVAILAWSLTSGGWRWVTAVVAVVVVATVWGLFLAPKAAVALPAPVVLIVEASLFLGTGLSIRRVEQR